ncbi:MAG: hypothetical protein F6J98_35430 [Moorea sp. SIO4G2]|nr:hypothetical protein [Moorena sp. SIO4G2]
MVRVGGVGSEVKNCCTIARVDLVRAGPWVVRYGAASGAKKLNIKPSPPLTHPTQYLPPRFPIPDSRFPTPYSRFPVPCSLNKKNSVKSWLIPILDRIISCNSQ